MKIVYLTSTIFAAAVALVSAAAKLRRGPKVVRVIHGTTRVPMRYLSPLAACEVDGALGLLMGKWWPPVGVAAGAGLMLYVVARSSPLRVGDTAGIVPALFVLILVAAALGTRGLTM